MAEPTRRAHERAEKKKRLSKWNLIYWYLRPDCPDSRNQGARVQEPEHLRPTGNRRGIYLEKEMERHEERHINHEADNSRHAENVVVQAALERNLTEDTPTDGLLDVNGNPPDPDPGMACTLHQLPYSLQT